MSSLRRLGGWRKRKGGSLKIRLVKSAERCSEAGVKEAKKRRVQVCPGGRLALKGGEGIGKLSCFAPHFIPRSGRTCPSATQCVDSIHGRIWKVNANARMDTNNGLGHPQRCTGRQNNCWWSLGKSALIPRVENDKGVHYFGPPPEICKSWLRHEGPCVNRRARNI